MKRELRLPERRQYETAELRAMPIVGDGRGGGEFWLLASIVGSILFFAIFGVGVVTIIDWVLQ